MDASLRSPADLSPCAGFGSIAKTPTITMTYCVATVAVSTAVARGNRWYVRARSEIDRNGAVADVESFALE